MLWVSLHCGGLRPKELVEDAVYPQHAVGFPHTVDVAWVRGAANRGSLMKVIVF